MKKLSIPATAQTGFTIVEIMIATVVFSVILLVITYGVMHFTSDYYKGINSSSTQKVARTIATDIGQAIEFSGSNGVQSDANGSTTGGNVCAGNQTFAFKLGKQPQDLTTNYGFLQVTGSNCDTSGSKIELLQKNMRLTYLKVTPADATNELWTIQVTVAYGGSDLLCDATVSPASPHGCGSSAQSYGATDRVVGPDIRCKIQTGQQFCSVVSLSTTVGRRLD